MSQLLFLTHNPPLPGTDANAELHVCTRNKCLGECLITVEWFSYIVSLNSRVPTRNFSVSGFFFGYVHSLAPLVVAYAPQGSPGGLSTGRRATSGSEKYHLCLRTFWAALRVLEVRILDGSSLQTALTKPQSGKSTPGRYTAMVYRRIELPGV